jgi:hypothetical protein
MTPVEERDFPKGHPKAFDYDPKSPEAIEWVRQNVHPLGERAYPVDSIKSSDTPGHECNLKWLPGVDPRNPHLEAFTGATPEVAAARKAAEQAMSALARETPTLPEGYVDTGKIAHESAVKFLLSLGHSETEAEQVIAVQGLDQVLAAKDTLAAKG